jgi:hypothetical protein
MVFRLDGTVVAFGGIGLGGREQRDL